jgi:UDP-N-acetylglucosamine enolpyruvyl transferase
MLGANILMVDSQRIIVEGPCTYKGGDVTSPGIIQACKALFLAGLCDDVETTIHGADILKRRYPDIIEKYNSLGAKIEQLD